ncbi:conserved membrane hypothetical protein [Candidatus Roizmanbacteria bacterium]|nr:conserved membrane hypothetical protein [Candidatus Roizmanbacteria bacterium]
MLNKKIFFIFLFAFLIRLISLNQSLWLDEAVTAKVVMNYGFTEIVSKFSPTDFHPPLYYLFMKLWTNMFGYSEIALRIPSVLFSLMTGYVVYLIGGIWAATFFLFNPLIVYYSQEARMYMMTTFLLTGGLYYFLKSQKLEVKSQSFDFAQDDPEWNRTGQKLDVSFFSISISLAFLTFYGSIFFIVTVFIYLIFKKQYKYFIVSLLIFVVSLLIISPLLYQQLVNSKVTLSNVTNWSLVLGKANIKNLLLIPIKFSIGRISFHPKWLYWGIAGIWTGLILYQISKIKYQNDRLKLKNVNLMLYFLILPLVLGFIISFFTPMLQYFRFLYLIPIVCLLLGFRLSGQAKFNLGGWILATGFLIFSLVYLLNPAFHREDWKSLVKNLPKDKSVYMITASSDPVTYYKNNLIVRELNGLTGSRVNELDREIIVIPYSVDIYGYDYKKNLSKNGYQLKKEVSFREVTYEQWIKK